jgi:hypothetical protein
MPLLRPRYPRRMATKEVKTRIGANGLRYKSKVNGSPFVAPGAFAAGTMSCFKCGKHRPRSSLKSWKILGRAHPVCDPACSS